MGVRGAALLALLLQVAAGYELGNHYTGVEPTEVELQGSLVRTTSGRYVLVQVSSPYQAVRVNISKVAQTNPRTLVAVTTLVPGQRKYTLVSGEWAADGTFLAEKVSAREGEGHEYDGSFTPLPENPLIGPVRTDDGLYLLPNFACYTSTNSRATCSAPPEGSDLDVFSVATLQDCCTLCHSNPAVCDEFMFAGQPILFGDDRSLEYPAGSCWMWRSDPDDLTIAPNLATDDDWTVEDVLASLPPWRSYSFNDSTFYYSSELIVDPINGTVGARWYQGSFYNVTTPVEWLPRSYYEGYVPLDAAYEAALLPQVLQDVGDGMAPVAYILHTGVENNYYMNATANEQYFDPETGASLGIGYKLESESPCLHASPPTCTSMVFNKTALGFELPVAPFLWACGYADAGAIPTPAR